jgi:hypothetical protein
VPRGGNRRRKSMEPRALAHIDGNLTTTPRAVSADLSPIKGQNRQSSAYSETENHQYTTPLKPAGEPSTPVQRDYDYADLEMTMSPTTPYFLKPEKIVQQSCPPKQASEPLFFPKQSRLRVENEESVRQRLLLARRKTMQWAPKVGSPLVRATSYTAE